MNVNPLIISALSTLNLPYSPDVYKGTGLEYYSLVYIDERAEVSGDDDDLYDVTAVQVHYFTKGDPHTNKKAIRRLLRAAGFTIVSTDQTEEADTDYKHVIVEAEIEGIIND